MIKTNGMINKYEGNENLATGKRIDKGHRKMLLYKDHDKGNGINRKE